MFIGLNPSTADETQDDPTIRRCIDFSKRWNFSALCMTNLFAFRATQPKDMMREKEPIGEDNDATLIRLAEGAGIIIAAWGKDGNWMYRGIKVKSLIPNLKFLKLNKDKTPAHPLYLKSDLVPISFD